MKSLGKCRGCNRRKLINLMRLCKRCNKQAHKFISRAEMAAIQKEHDIMEKAKVKAEKKAKVEEEEKEGETPEEGAEEGAEGKKEAPAEA
ncbi:MAG: hypothetical protein JSV49_07850 [Thermoplasmata archaeon]|nr:MAG: hypothetical protein JSV49_07850 [Thermoplasmata archaeon]